MNTYYICSTSTIGELIEEQIITTLSEKNLKHAFPQGQILEETEHFPLREVMMVYKFKPHKEAK